MLEDHADPAPQGALLPAGHPPAVHGRLPVLQHDGPPADFDFAGIRVFQQIEAAHKG